jgi:hypothetical protein
MFVLVRYPALGKLGEWVANAVVRWIARYYSRDDDSYISSSAAEALSRIGGMGHQEIIVNC